MQKGSARALPQRDHASLRGVDVSGSQRESCGMVASWLPVMVLLERDDTHRRNDVVLGRRSEGRLDRIIGRLPAKRHDDARGDAPSTRR